MSQRNPYFSSQPTPRQLNRLAGNVTSSQRAGPGMIVAKTGNHYQVSAITKNGRGGTSLMQVRVSAYDAATKAYTFIGLVTDGTGHFTDASPTVTYTGFEQHDFIGIELGARVLIRPAGTLTASVGSLPAGTAVFSFSFVNPRATFAVKLFQTGGSNGTATTAATWLYRVENSDAHVLGTSGTTPLAPLALGWRLGKGPVTAATDGEACYDDAGTLILMLAFEQHGNVPCGGS